MRVRAVHIPLDSEMTRCGLLVEGLETRVSSGTREFVLETTTDIAAVTCKRCQRIAARLAKGKHNAIIDADLSPAKEGG